MKIRGSDFGILKGGERKNLTFVYPNLVSSIYGKNVKIFYAILFWFISTIKLIYQWVRQSLYCMGRVAGSLPAGMVLFFGRVSFMVDDFPVKNILDQNCLFVKKNLFHPTISVDGLSPL